MAVEILLVMFCNKTLVTKFFTYFSWGGIFWWHWLPGIFRQCQRDDSHLKRSELGRMLFKMRY